MGWSQEWSWFLLKKLLGGKRRQDFSNASLLTFFEKNLSNYSGSGSRYIKGGFIRLQFNHIVAFMNLIACFGMPEGNRRFGNPLA